MKVVVEWARQTSGPERSRQMALGEQESEECLIYLSKNVNVAKTKSSQGKMAVEDRG